jgi:hypothetical protein
MWRLKCDEHNAAITAILQITVITSRSVAVPAIVSRVDERGLDVAYPWNGEWSLRQPVPFGGKTPVNR